MRKPRDRWALFLHYRALAIKDMREREGKSWIEIFQTLNFGDVDQPRHIYEATEAIRESNRRRPNRKLNEEKVRDIRRAFRNGETKTAIAKRFRVSHHTVTDVVTNQTWKER